MTDKKPKPFNVLKRATSPNHATKKVSYLASLGVPNRKISPKSTIKPPNNLKYNDFGGSFIMEGFLVPDHSGATKNPDFTNKKFSNKPKSLKKEQIKLNINDIFKKFFEDNIIIDQNILITENKLPQMIDYSKIEEIGYLRRHEPNEEKEKFQNKIIAQIIANNIDNKINKYVEFQNYHMLISPKKARILSENACKPYIDIEINPISSIENHEKIYFVQSNKILEYHRKKGLLFGYYFYCKEAKKDMRTINKYNLRDGYGSAYVFYATENDAYNAIKKSRIIDYFYHKFDRINRNMGLELHLFLRDKNCLKDTINQISESFRKVKTEHRFFSNNIDLDIFEVAINKAVRNYKDFLDIIIKNDLQVRASKILHFDYGIEVDNFFNERVKKSITRKIAIDVLTSIATKREN